MTKRPEDTTKSFSERVAAEIRVEMARQDIRQSQLARRLGENDTWLSVRLRGRQEIGVNDLARIATALDVEIHSLLPAGQMANTLRNHGVTKKARSERRSTVRTPHAATRPPARPGKTSPKANTRRPVMIRRPLHG